MKKEKLNKIIDTLMTQLFYIEEISWASDVPVSQRADLIIDKISEYLFEDIFENASLPNHLTALCRISGLSKNETLKKFIKNDKVELWLLIEMKAYFKELCSKCSDKTEHEIYNVTCYAVIACALLYHQKRISNYSYKQLANRFSRFLKEEWLPDYILILFKQAQKQAEKKVKKRD